MPALSKSEFESRSEFRYRLTCFLRFGQQVAEAAGITFPQYLLLLHIKGIPGRSWAVVGELAERLQLKHHSTVELVSRCELSGLVERRKSEQDRREVQIHLTRGGERMLQRVAAAQTEELASLAKGLGFDNARIERLPFGDSGHCDASANAARAAAANSPASARSRRASPRRY